MRKQMGGTLVGLHKARAHRHPAVCARFQVPYSPDGEHAAAGTLHEQTLHIRGLQGAGTRIDQSPPGI